MDRGALEGIARDVLETTGLDTPPVDAFELAAACGLTVCRSGAPGARYARGCIWVDATVRTERQHGLVAHELGHWALDRARDRNTERAARYLAGALLLPRTAFDRDLAATRWNLVELHALHPNASYELIARRICTIRDAVAVVVDNGRVTARVDRDGWLPPELGARGWALVDEVLRTAAPVNPANLCWAVPVFDGTWRRVVLVAERASAG